MTAEPEVLPYMLDDALVEATALDGAARVRVYRPGSTLVVLGRGSRPDAEVVLDACTSDSVPLHRRRGGGCAVVLHDGVVVVSAALAVEGIGQNVRHFRRLSAWLVGALARLDVEGLRQDGISDLVRGDRKVGGACIWRSPGLLLYSATLLVDPRASLMERYLRHPPREPAYRRGRTHAGFVAALDAGGHWTDARALELALVETLRAP